jgi:hypothetical protein
MEKIRRSLGKIYWLRLRWERNVLDNEKKMLIYLAIRLPKRLYTLTESAHGPECVADDDTDEYDTPEDAAPWEDLSSDEDALPSEINGGLSLQSVEDLEKDQSLPAKLLIASKVSLFWHCIRLNLNTTMYS